MKVVIKDARAAGRLLMKEVTKAAGADRVLDTKEKGATYARDKVVGKAMYRFEDAMTASFWGGGDPLPKTTVGNYDQAVKEAIKQLVAIDSYKGIGNKDGVVTQSEISAYPRTKGTKLPLMANTLVEFMIAAKNAGKL